MSNKLFFAAALLLPAVLFSHGVEVSEVESGAKIVRFLYTDGEPMMYAKVKVYPPSAPKTETIKSLTDENGFFAFVPDESGEWKVEALDGMGHRGEIMINAFETASGVQNTQNGYSASLVFRIILGLSLLFNIFVLCGFVLRKKTAFMR
jgi:nickel transport protein